jgi:CRP-like cAMP-binding protein
MNPKNCSNLGDETQLSATMDIFGDDNSERIVTGIGVKLRSFQTESLQSFWTFRYLGEPIMPLRIAAKKKRDFDPHDFLATIGEGRKVVVFTAKQTIFAQGDAADAVFYIQKGKVRLSVLSESGKGATIGILTDGDFFGEGCLAGQPRRTGSATAMTGCDLLRIDKKAMIEALHREHTFSDLFVAYLLARSAGAPHSQARKPEAMPRAWTRPCRVSNVEPAD